MKKYIYNILTLTAIVCLTLILACAPTTTPPPTPPSPPLPTQEKPPQQAAPQEELPTFPITVTDDLGRRVAIQKLPQRIVSLAPSVTEILFALGLDDRIVGTTDYCDYPEAAKSKTRVSGYSTPDLEKIVAVQPDLILAESIHENTVLPALEKLGLPVFVTSATSIDVILREITVLGQITGKSKAAQKLANDMTQRINAVTSRTSALPAKDRPGVLYVVWFNPIWTMGSETFTDDLIAKAGGTNVFSADFERARVVSLEAVVTKNPQVILVSAMATTADLVYNSIKKESRLAGIDAIKNNRVYKITDSNLIERPGPRIVEGLDEVAKLIHPEIFGAKESK